MYTESAQSNRGKCGGFTLLEITLAVAILAMMALAIYRFVQTNLVAIRVSSDSAAQDERYGGLRDLLTAQWQSLTPGDGRLLGETFKFNDRPRDEITWICGAGPGLLTRYAPGDFGVTMRLQREDEKSDRMDLGFLRKPKDKTDIAGEEDTWVPLIENVPSLEIRYFDSRLNTWLNRWTDTVTLPRLVKIDIGRPGGRPWEIVIPLARTPL